MNMGSMPGHVNLPGPETRLDCWSPWMGWMAAGCADCGLGGAAKDSTWGAVGLAGEPHGLSAHR